MPHNLSGYICASCFFFLSLLKQMWGRIKTFCRRWGGGGSTCNSQRKIKKIKAPRPYPEEERRRRNPESLKCYPVIAFHQRPWPSGGWRGRTESFLHTRGGGEDLPGLDFNDGGTLLSRTHAVHFLPWGSYLVLGKQAEDVELGGGGWGGHTWNMVMYLIIETSLSILKWRTWWRTLWNVT